MMKIEKLKYYIFNVFNFSNKKIEFFLIKRKINNLIYEINLLMNMKIHKIISIIYFKQIFSNEYERRIFTSPFIKNDKKKFYIIKKIIKNIK